MANTTSVYGAFTWFNNPGIRVYEKRTEPHTGARTVFTNQLIKGKQTLYLAYGAEVQKGIFTVKTYRNNKGNPDTLQTDDEVNNWQYMYLHKRIWLLRMASLSLLVPIIIKHLSAYPSKPLPVVPQNRRFGNVISPRFAVLKSFKHISVYGLVSQGFSPPTTF